MAYEADFERWWAGCWLKIGRLAAKREYERARKVHRATAEELIAGRDLYRQRKPSWQEWVHPKTWLHQGRWADEWDVPKPKLSRADVDWWEECKALHGGACVKRWDHEMKMRAVDA